MRMLITAGPTREPIDEVRFLSNRSSGTLGVALANAAAEAGHGVTLLLGPVIQEVALHGAVRRVDFETVEGLQGLLETHFPSSDALVMAAAVGDYRLTKLLSGKAERKGELVLRLTATPDLVAGVAERKREDQVVVAFALEEAAHLEERAVAKMERKGVDAIVANPLETMEAGEIEAVFLTADGGREAAGRMSKMDFAAWLVERVAGMRGG